MKKVFSSNFQGSSLKFSIPLGILISIVLFVAIPLTQILSDSFVKEQDVQSSRVQIQPPPPPPPEVLEPPEEEEKEEDIEMKREERQLSLDQINMALNAGDGGMSSNGISVQVFDISLDFEDMVFEIADLDQAPIPLVKIVPVYPPKLKRKQVTGTVTVVFIVDEDGNVKRPSIEKTSNSEFNKSVLKAIRQWKFEAGEKDGRKVKTRLRVPLTFTVRR